MPVLTKINTNVIANDAITSAKVADDALADVDISDSLTLTSIKQTDAQNLSGTYSTHELIMGKTFTLTGDLTVNTNLVLVNMSGSGDDITIQDDGTATTITGTGKLEGGSLLAKERSNLTGMTGTLGSGVTGGSGLTALGTVASGTLGANVVFPFIKHLFSATRTVDMDISNGTWTNILFTSSGSNEEFDVSNALASDKFTVPSGEDGKYMFVLNIGCDVGVAGKYMSLVLYKNGSVIWETQTTHRSDGGTIKANTTHILDLSAADYIEPYLYQNSGSTKGISPPCRFSGFKLSHL